MENNEYKCKLSIYNPIGEMIEFNLPNQFLNLENNIFTSSCTPTNGDESMAYKIKRKVILAGKPRWITASTEQEYADKIIQLSGGYAQNEGEEKHLFGEYAVNWFNVYSKPNVSDVTAITYERQLKKYLLPSFGDKYIEDISTDDIQCLFNDIKIKKASKEKIKTVLNQIIKSAIDDRYIDRNPLNSNKLKITGKASKTTEPYSVEQMRYIEKHIGDVKNEQDRMFIALQAFHPMRLEEVLGLKWSDIDIENKLINIVRAVSHPDRNQPVVKETKTAGSVRQLGLFKSAVQYLEPKSDNEFVIGGEKALSYTQVRRMCDRIQKEIGFNDKITPIRFRPTVLTDIYEQTKDVSAVQKAAGHTSPTMTFKHYVNGRGTPTKTTEAVEALYAV